MHGIEPQQRERVEQRFRDWWEGRLGEPLLAVRAPVTDRHGRGTSNTSGDENHWWEDDLHTLHGGAEAGDPELAQIWTDPDRLLPRYQELLRINWFGGDWLPVVWPNFSPCIISAFLGAKLSFGPRTTWQEPAATLHEVAAGEFDPLNVWWQRTAVMVERALSNWDGRFVVGFPDWGAVTDALANLVGHEALCVAVVTEPALVRRAGARLLEIQLELVRRLAEGMLAVQGGTCSWHGCWSPGITYPVQSDLCVLFSPRQFRDVFLPLLDQECSALTHAAYHLDGPEALRHLDALLEIPSLRAIQWIPGAGAPPTHQWLDLYRRIQAAGRAVIVEAEYEAVPLFLRELRPEGLFLRTACPTREHGLRLLEACRKGPARRTGR
ncbi:MAG: hypothetical protein AB1486_02920 [Planctomycetota bacterium]